MPFDASARPSTMMTTVRPSTVVSTVRPDGHTAPRVTGTMPRATATVAIAQTIALRIDHLVEDIVLDPKALRRTLPDVASEVIELCGHSNAAADTMERALTRDPFISAQVVSIANSAMFAPRMPILSVRDAVVRIGLDAVRDVVMMVVANSTMFRVPGFAVEVETLRRRMLASACVARLLARALGAESEYGFLAGLLHDIGYLVMLERSVQDGVVTPPIWASPAEGDLIRERFQAHHTSVGGAVCKSWKLPSGVSDAAQFHHDYKSGGKTHLAAHLVAAADIATEYIMPGMEPPEAPVGAQPVILELGLEPAQIEALVSQARPAAASLIGGR